jgi:hypothetical protein
MDDIRRGRGVFSRNATPAARHEPANRGGAGYTVSSAQPSGDSKSGGKHQSAQSGKRMKLLLAAGGTLIVVLLATSGFLFWQYTNSSDSDDQDDAAAISQRIIDKVDGLYLVPQDEEPTVAAIRDKSKLKDQAFFDKAQNGDYILIYEQAGLALIYRESADKLVNASSVGISPEAAADSQQEQGSAGESPEATQ